MASLGTRRVLESGSMKSSASSIAKRHGRDHSPKWLEEMHTLAPRSNTELHANYGSSGPDGRLPKNKKENSNI